MFLEHIDRIGWFDGPVPGLTGGMVPRPGEKGGAELRSGRFPCSVILLGALLLVVCGAGGRADEEPGAAGVSEAKVSQLVADLDHDRFAVRERARLALLEIGRPAVPMLLEATASESPEQRLQARDLVHEIRARELTGHFEELAATEGDALDVELGMWLIARILDPEVKRDTITRQLDAMADSVRRRLGEDAPGERKPRQTVDAIAAVLRDDFGLAGDEDTYDHPDNSSIHRVLKRRKGLPILLSEITVAIARRLSVPLVGLGIPGRYMVLYDLPGEDGDLILDPFGGWEVVTLKEVREAAPFLAPARDLVPSSGRSTLVRMLNNLHADALEQQEQSLAEAALRYRALLAPEDEQP